MTERLERFLSLSANLTGFDRLELLETGVLADYLEVVDQAISTGRVDSILSAYSALADSPDRDQAIGTRILDDEQHGPVARSLMVLWYTGTWQPVIHSSQSPEQADLDQPRVVSPAAYMAGLQWRTIHAHPAGALPPGFGSWAHPPLGDFS